MIPCPGYCLSPGNGMSGLFTGGNRRTAEETAGETGGKPETVRAGKGLYPYFRYSEICRFRTGTEDEKCCCTEAALQRAALCDSEKRGYAGSFVAGGNSTGAGNH